jgi:hypothetical protein
MRVPLIAFIFFCLATAGTGAISPVFAQIFGSTTDSPRSLAMGGSDLADAHDEWVPNPAMAADTLSNLRVPLTPLPLGLPQSFAAGFGADMPVNGNILAGASLSRYEYADAFAYQSFGLQASKTFQVSGAGDTSRRAIAGIRIRYSEETFGTEYAPLDDLGVDLGASFDLFPKLTLAVAVTHLLSLLNNQRIPIEDRVGWLGISYRATSDLILDAALESSPAYDAAFHAGAEYAIDPHLFVRAGTDTGTGEISAGLGVHEWNFTADFAAIRHPDLGTSVSFGIGFAL